MKIYHYDSTGQTVTTDLSNLDFGEITAGQHNTQVQTVRPTLDTENTVNDVWFFLENDGGWDSSNFGFQNIDSFDSALASASGGDARMSTHLTEVNNAEASDSASGQSLAVADDTAIDYVYLDMDVDSMQTGSTSTINYRVVFDYT